MPQQETEPRRMLRHACGFALANSGTTTRALQATGIPNFRLIDSRISGADRPAASNRDVHGDHRENGDEDVTAC
jgi:hypothetical protein